MLIATHAVVPTCPRCGHHVRGSVELQAELVDLKSAALVALAAARGSASLDSAADRDSELGLINWRLAEIRAEVAGEHLRCSDALH